MQSTSQPKHNLRKTLPVSLVLMSVLGLSSLPALCLAAIDDRASLAQELAPQQSIHRPKIQLAILLDTSNSMDGLIDQARNQLWKAVNEFSQAKQNGVSPILEVAVIEYGNDRISSQSGHTRQVIGFTQELDRVSEALFSLTTDGGNEFCGYAIHRAVASLNWSASDQDIKAIFIAGNESFSQGKVSVNEAISAAGSKGITINTIFAGNGNDAVHAGWREGAVLAGGKYLNIDHNHRVAHVVAPQDKKIAELNEKLNQTYIPYGTQGEVAAKRQRDQDGNSGAVSLGLLAERIKSKVSSLYNNANWDLVDAIDTGAVELDEVKEAQLPAAMRVMTPEERKAHIQSSKEQRAALQNEISALSQARDQYVAEQEHTANGPQVDTLQDALSAAVRTEGEKKAFTFHTP